MTKRPVKLLPIWIAVSSVIILAGIILFALLGFNYSAERNARKTVEVEYDVVVVTDPTGVAMLKETCEDVFKKTGVSYSDFSQTVKIDASTGSETVGGKLVYTFSANLSDESLAAVKAGIDTRIIERTAEGILPVGADISVSVHELANYHFTDAAWRGAIAVAVGAVVALVYIAIRFGVGCALTGLTVCVHDVFLSLGLLAILRIPVYFFAPIVVGAVAAFMSLLLWLIQCMKMRDNFKSPSYASYSADEAVEQSSKSAAKAVYITAAAMGIVLAVFTIALAIASAQLGAILLPLVCLIPVGISVYSSLLFGPALHVPVKTAFDKIKFKHKRRLGKAKAEKKKEEN